MVGAFSDRFSIVEQYAFCEIALEERVERDLVYFFVVVG